MALKEIDLGNVRGPQGPQGIQGKKGEPGVQGERGEDGATYTQIDDMAIKNRILASYQINDNLQFKSLTDVEQNVFGGYWIDGSTLKRGETSDKTRVATPIFKISNDIDVDFRFPDDYQWCSATCSDSAGNNAKWDKSYAGGNKYKIKAGYNAIQFKHVSNRALSEEEKNTLCVMAIEQVYSSQITSMLNKLNSKAEGYDFIFPFITDIHHFPTTDLKWSGNVKNNNIKHLRGLIELSGKFPVDCSVIGGDMSYDWTTMDLFKGFIEDVGKESQKIASPVYFMAGNHDFGDAYNFGKTGKDAVLSPAQLNNLLGRAASKTMYYHKDFYKEKIRMIFLNTDDNYILEADGTTKYPRVPNGNDDETIHVVGNEQGKWLSEVLKTPSEGWTIILLSHVPLRAQTQNSQAIADLINARRNKTSKSFSNTNSNPDFTWKFSVDYSQEYDVDIVGWISGHTHSDAINNFNNIKVITVTQAMGDNTGLGKEDIDPSKTTFDVFCLDKDNRKLDIKRFGSVGTDRSITY